MLNRLEEQFGERAINGDISQMDMLQEKVSALRRRVEEMDYNKIAINKKEELNSEDETDEDEEEDYVEDLKTVIANKKNRGPRASVSAEAFGTFNKKEDFKARVVPKSEESKAAILEKLNKAFMFQALSDKEKEIVIDAMEEINAPENESIIKEGE